VQAGSRSAMHPWLTSKSRKARPYLSDMPPNARDVHAPRECHVMPCYRV
jgi:hypothetical protein